MRSRQLRRAAAAVLPDQDTFAATVAELVSAALRSELAPPPLLDLAGAAERLNVSPRTIENLVAAGDLPVIRIGTGRGTRRFEPAALEAFIRRQARSL